MARVLYGLQSMFSLWMIVDCAQRGASRYWYPIIWFPFGPFVYFFAVKIHDREFRALREPFLALFRPKVTLEQLRYRLTETPSFANKLALAQGLFDAAQNVEAVKFFDEILAADEECKDALYGRALCRIEVKEYECAIEDLRHLIEIKPSFHEYDGWARLAKALQLTGKPEEALAVLEDLVKKTPRVPHRVLYARYLREAGRHEEARKQIELALQDHKHSPGFQKRQDAAAARAGRVMLGEMQAK